LKCYDLEERGHISDWKILRGGGNFRIMIPPEFARLGKEKELHECRHIEALVEDSSTFAKILYQWKPCDFKWRRIKTSGSNMKIPEYDIAKTIMRSINRGRGVWHQTESRYVLWVPSYTYHPDKKLKIDLFPEAIAVSYWPNENSKAYLPEYSLQYYRFIQTATEFFRSALSFVEECKARRKENLGEARRFYLSLVYPADYIAELTERVVIYRDTSFLNRRFFDWASISPDEDPRLTSDPHNYAFRKIRT
jgi:hypothetical protein